MLRRIEFRNFQGFKGTQEAYLAPITLVFGQNSSGKSSVVRALKLFREIYENLDSYDDLTKAFSSEGTDFSPLKFSSAQNEPMSLVLDFDVQRDKWWLNAPDLPEEIDNFYRVFNRVRMCYTDEFIEAKFRVDQTNRKLPGQSARLNMSYLRPLDGDLDWPWTLRDFDNSLATKTDSENTWINRDHIWWEVLFGAKPSLKMAEDELNWMNDGPSISDITDFFPKSSGTVFDSDDAYNNKFWRNWLKIADAEIRSFELTTVNAVREQPPMITDNPDVLKSQNLSLDNNFLTRLNNSLIRLTSGRYEYQISSINQSLQATKRSHRFLVRDNLTGSETSFENVGSGLSHVLPILGALASSDSKYIYIEQPEQHLHPIMQAKLAEEFALAIDPSALDDARDAPTYQIIAETHSENLLLGIQKLVRTSRLDPKMVSIIYTEPFEEVEGVGYNRIFNIEMNKWGELIDPFPVSFADLRAQYLWDLDGRD
jgi:predicted ATP-dependent endonuclease of OLD family